MEFEGRSRISLQLNMAPLIDVMLLLLIFFMLTSTYMVAEAIDLELPFSNSSRESDATDITVSLSGDGVISVNGRTVLRADLRATVSELLPDPQRQTITLETDSEETVQAMIDVMDILREAGGVKVLIATQGEKP